MSFRIMMAGLSGSVILGAEHSLLPVTEIKGKHLFSLYLSIEEAE